MTGMLASVRTLDEAHIVVKAGADILDLKAPEQGALGAVEYSVAEAVVQEYKKTILISATIGDMPLEVNQVDSAIKNMAATGVDIIKVGVFGSDLSGDIINCFKKHTANKIKIVLVFFADEDLELNSVFEKIDSTVVYGVMLDTANKSSGSLFEYLVFSTLVNFVGEASKRNLLTGLAGSLKVEDIKTLLPTGADYLGFRGALCEQSNRISEVNELAVYRVRSKIPLISADLPDKLLS